MKQLIFLIEKEFKQTFRNPFIPGMIVFYPLMVLLLFPLAINFEVKNIKLDIVDNDHTVTSQRLVDKLASSPNFNLISTSPDYQTAMNRVIDGDVDMIIEIPHQFERNMVKTTQSNVGLYVNAVNGTLGLLGNNYAQSVIRDFSDEMRQELLPKRPHISIQQMPSVNIDTQYRFNPRLDYKDYMLPAFMVILLTLICGILPALNIVSEKENGTINQINVTPISKLNFILAKLIPYWIIGLVIILISITVCSLVYSFTPNGNLLLLLLSAVVFIFTISGMGIIISNYSSTLQQASFLVIFFILIIILLSGIFTPVSSMPKWAEAIAHVNPLTYFTRILRMIYLNGSRFTDIIGQLGMLAIFALVLNGWAVLSYRKRS